MRITILLFLSFMLLTCTQKKQTSEKIVTVTIEPQRYFAEQIAGDNYKIQSMVGPGMNPEDYDPTAQQMVQLGKSNAYLKVGQLGFEQAWMDRIAKNNPELLIFDMSQGFDLQEEEGTQHTDADHDKTGSDTSHTHKHGGADPHIWSSFAGAKTIAKNTLDAFSQIDPTNKAYYQANYERLIQEIQQTEDSVSQLLADTKGKSFIIYHPALTYLAKEYGLHQLCIEVDGKEPSPAQLQKLIQTARDNQVHVVFVQLEFDKKNAEAIADETNGIIVYINPLAYNWNEEMIRIAEALSNGKTN